MNKATFHVADDKIGLLRCECSAIPYQNYQQTPIHNGMMIGLMICVKIHPMELFTVGTNTPSSPRKICNWRSHGLGGWSGLSVN